MSSRGERLSGARVSGLLFVWILIGVGPLAPAAWSQTAASPAASGPARAYKNVVLETAGAAGRIENGALVIRGDKILAVGKAADVTIPDDAKVIDAQGWTILPGLVDPYNTLRGGASAGPARTFTLPNGRVIEIPDDGPRGGTTFTKVTDLFVPYRYRKTPLVRVGITTANLVPDGYGQAAVIQLQTNQPDRMLINPEGLLAVGVSNDSNTLDIIRRPLQVIARASGAPASAAATPSAAPGDIPSRFRRPGGPGGPGPGPGGPGGGDTPKADAGAGASSGGSTSETLWRAVYEGKSPLLVNVVNPAGLLHLQKILDEYKNVKVILVLSGSDLLLAQPAIESLANAKRLQTVILNPGWDIRPSTRNRVNTSAVLTAKKIPFVFTLNASTILRANPDVPLFILAQLVKSGLPRADAIRAVTLGPATLIGADKTAGSLETGKTANILIFEGDPLDAAGRLRQVLVEGKTVYEVQP